MSNPNLQQQQAQQRMMQQQRAPAGGAAGAGPMPSTGGGPPAPPAGLANYSIPHLLELYKKNQLNDEQMIQFRDLMKQYGPQIQQYAQRGAAAGPGGAAAGGSSSNPAGGGVPNAGGPNAMGGGAGGARPPPTAASQQQARAAQIQLIQSLQSMPDAQRASTLAAQPQLQALWSRYQAIQKAAPGNSNPLANLNNANANNPNAPSPALPNLQLPPGRTRLNQPAAGTPNNQPNRPPSSAPPGLTPQQQQQLLILQQQQQQQNAGKLPPPGSNLRTTSPANASAANSTPGPSTANNPLGSSSFNTSTPHLTPAQLQAASSLAFPGSSSTNATNNTLNANNLPQPHPLGSARPTLSGGLASGGSVLGTPSHLVRTGSGWGSLAAFGGLSGLNGMDPARGGGERKRKLRDVVESVEKGEILEDAVEDLMLELVDELIDSSTHFAARLAKHRKSNTLEVRDLQLHLERNHGIRVPGLGTDGGGSSSSTKRPAVASTHAQRIAAVNLARSQQLKRSK